MNTKDVTPCCAYTTTSAPAVPVLLVNQAAKQCGIDLSVNSLAFEFVLTVAKRLNTLPESDRAPAIQAVVNALEEGGPNTGQRIIDALYPQVGAA